MYILDLALKIRYTIMYIYRDKKFSSNCQQYIYIAKLGFGLSNMLQNRAGLCKWRIYNYISDNCHIASLLFVYIIYT